MSNLEEIIAVSDFEDFVSRYSAGMRAIFTIIDYNGMSGNFDRIVPGRSLQKIRLEPQHKDAKLFIAIKSNNPKEPADDFYILFYRLHKEDKDNVKQFMIDYNFLSDGELVFEEQTGCQIFTIGQLLSHQKTYRQNFFALIANKAKQYAQKMDKSIQSGSTWGNNLFGNWDELNRYLKHCYYSFWVENNEYRKVINIPDNLALSYWQLVNEVCSDKLSICVCNICENVIHYSGRGRPPKFCPNCNDEVKREYNKLYITEVQRKGLTGADSQEKEEEIREKAWVLVKNRRNR